MWRQPCFLLLTLCTGLLASAGSAHECSGITDGAARLKCFDEAFPAESKTAVPDSPAASVDKGAWQVKEDRNPMTDEPRVNAMLQSLERVPGRYRDNDYAVLYLRCDENTTAMTIWFGGAFMSSSEYHSFGDIRYRVDDSPAKTRAFQESTSNEHLGLWNGASSIPVIKQMLGGKKLMIEATPYNENPVTLHFDITGIDQAVAPIRKTCGW